MTSGAVVAREQPHAFVAPGVYNALHLSVEATTVSVYRPGEPALAVRLAAPEAMLVACLCADWCGTCRDYAERFADLATRRPELTFVWIDVEDDTVAGDEDIEDFPTLFVQDAAGVLFYGTMLPHIGHLEKLLDTVRRSRPPAPSGAPDLLTALRQP